MDETMNCQGKICKIAIGASVGVFVIGIATVIGVSCYCHHRKLKEISSPLPGPKVLYQRSKTLTLHKTQARIRESEIEIQSIPNLKA